MNIDFKLEGTEKVQIYRTQVKEKPLVSVCVMTYNHENYIRECLDGILMQQTDFDFEILLGEDDSNDKTREICIEYAKNYPEKIRLFLHDRSNVIYVNGNPTGRYNFIYNLTNAKGKYIAICEGDDYWTDPNKLQKQVNFLEDNQSYVAACQAYRNSYYVNNKLKYGHVKEGKPMSLTLLFRNIIKKYPIEMMEAPNGDTFLRAMLQNHGDFYYIEGLSPCVRNVHEGGAVSTLHELQLWPRRIKTHEAILKYYKGTKKENFYREKLARFRIKYNSLLLNNTSYFKKSVIFKDSFREALHGYSMLYFIKVMIFKKD